MSFREIIIKFLGLKDVVIEELRLFRKERRVEVRVRQKRESCFCPHCGLQFEHVKEWQLRTLRAPPMGVYQNVIIKFMQLRGDCRVCKRTSVARVDWIHPTFESMTCGFAEVAGRLMEEITCEAVGRILTADSKAMWALDQHRMEVMFQFMQLPKDLDASYLCADEVHFRTLPVTNRKGLFAKTFQPQFVTNLVAPKEGKVLFNALGRDSKALSHSLRVLSDGQKLAVEKFAVDMHEPYISAILKHCPNAQVVIDRFHLAQHINKAFDKLRRIEFKKAKANKDTLSENMLEPHRRFILVARDADLSKSEMKLVDKLRLANKDINCGMLLVEYFHKALDQKKVSDFRKVLLRWYQLCRNTRLEPFLEFARTLRRYRKNIEAYITSRLTTAVIEGLNNKIKVLKRMGYGYTNPISFCRKILQRCGYLNHRAINTDEFFFKWPNPA